MANDRIFLVHTRSRKAICLGKEESKDDSGNHGWVTHNDNFSRDLNYFYSLFEMGNWKTAKYHGDQRMFHLEYEEAALDLSWMNELYPK